MNTGKYIALASFLILPLLIVGQTLRPVTKKEAEQIGKRMYILSTGDTTWVVNNISGGLHDPDASFLFRKNKSPEIDSIFTDSKSSYRNLEEAALDVDRLLREVELEDKINGENNDALSLRLARYNRSLKKKNAEAAEIADNIFKDDPSIEELVALRKKFGNKPSYFINGVEVPHAVVNQLYPSEVIERELRVVDTASGNPNGEVWYIVTEKALERIKIPVGLTYNYMQSRISSPKIVTNNEEPDQDLSSFLKEQKKQEAKDRLKPLPVVRREITADGKKVDRVIELKDEEDTSSKKQESIDTNTRVISRTINDQKVNTISRVAETPQPTTKQYNIEESSPTKKEEKMPKKTPKKSVRRIKKDSRN